MVKEVRISSKARKDLAQVPPRIFRKLLGWIEGVELEGLFEARKYTGFHDEPLKGDRVGQRSIRLNRCYRAFYELKPHQARAGVGQYVSIFEVNKHDY